MKTSQQILWSIIFFCILATGCKEKIKPQRGFYHWRTEVNISDSAFLKQNNISKLYIHLFDVDLSPQFNKPYPIAQARLIKLPDASVEIIPVVFIKNDVFLNMQAFEINALAEKIIFQSNYMTSRTYILYRELQIDCDWSIKTKDNYFKFLAHLRALLGSEGKRLSTTIRLHQVKYRERTGVPPADRGMLMFYNMGNISADTTENSIYDKTTAAKYLDRINDYPLTLDIALPAFSWGIQIRNNKVIHLLNQLTETDLLSDARFDKINNRLYKAKASFVYQGGYMKRDDLIKLEQTDAALTEQAAAQVAEYLAQDKPYTVTLFDLNSYKRINHETHSLTTIFDLFN